MTENLTPAQLDERAKKVAEDALAKLTVQRQLENSGRLPRPSKVLSAAERRTKEIAEQQIGLVQRPIPRGG